MKNLPLFFIRWPMPLAMLFMMTVSVYGQSTNENPKLSIVTDQTPGLAASHGFKKLTDALHTHNVTFEEVESLQEPQGESVLVVGLSKGEGVAAQLSKNEKQVIPEVAEALSIWKTNALEKPVWVISGYDDQGLMYALLDIAERVGWSKENASPLAEIEEITEQPDASDRGMSIYTMNRAYWESRFYDEDYWERYLDMLAQNRFNSLVVIFGYENGGFLAPAYPYFFDVEGFPDVRMVGITPAEQQRNLDALNRLIDMAHDRGIRFSVGIWDHIYRGGVQGGGIPGTQEAPDEPIPGLVWGVTADNLISYNKTALAEFVKKVPDLDGIQFRMHNESGLQHGEQEAFWLDVFKMMKVTAPNLRLDLRAKELPEPVIQSALEVGIDFRITTKYWMEQMGMPYHPTKTNPETSPIRHSYAYLLRYPQQYKIHWRLWNGGTSRILLWGSPEYVRRFVKSTHLYNGDGFEVNEPLATKMEAQPHDAKPFELLNSQYQYYDYEFERYWHFFQLFGRLGYNPDTSPEVWHQEFERRFGEKAGPLLEAALHKASWVLPRILTSVYPYSKFPTTRGWAEKQRLCDLPEYAKNEGSDLMQFANFDEEAQLLIDDGETPKVLPSTNSQWLEQTANEINSLTTQAENAMGDRRNNEFTVTLTDLKILSNLALFHARRIPAAVSYRLFERTQDVAALEEAITYESKAIEAWRQLVKAAGDVYTDNLMMGVCVADLCGHWKDELAALEEGLASLQKQQRDFMAEESGVQAAPQYQAAPDDQYDKLFDISHERVTDAPAGQPVTVRAKVSAPAGVKWVHLRYRNVNQDFDYQTLPMKTTNEQDIYQATVPAEEIDPTWDFMYLIEVMDNHGHGRIYPDLNEETPYIFVRLDR